MIFVDSNIPMYLCGADHPNKARVVGMVSQLLSAHETLVTSAEVFQEILHRYKAIHDPIHLQIAYEALEALVSKTESIHKSDTDRARALCAIHANLSSRDCLHVAVMQRVGCVKVWTFDSGFDCVPSLVRLF